MVVKRGPNAGSRFMLDRDLTTAGRHPDSDIFLDDVTVSRRHAEFRRTPEGRFTVVDVGSLNGTYLKRGRIDSAVLLSSGDEVQVGKFRLTFLAALAAAAVSTEAELPMSASSFREPDLVRPAAGCLRKAPGVVRPGPAQLTLADDLTPGHRGALRPS